MDPGISARDRERICKNSHPVRHPAGGDCRGMGAGAGREGSLASVPAGGTPFAHARCGFSMAWRLAPPCANWRLRSSGAAAARSWQPDGALRTQARYLIRRAQALTAGEYRELIVAGPVASRSRRKASRSPIPMTRACSRPRTLAGGRRSSRIMCATSSRRSGSSGLRR